jgi:hypothetical protein
MNRQSQGTGRDSSASRLSVLIPGVSGVCLSLTGTYIDGLENSFIKAQIEGKFVLEDVPVHAQQESVNAIIARPDGLIA